MGVPGEAIVEHLVESLNGLGPRELSACALAVATLGITDPKFWHQVCAAILTCIDKLAPRHVADTLLALATTQHCPIALMEALQSRVLQVMSTMEADEALTC